MNNGWIKLHRKILDNPLSKKPSWAWLWVILLLLANHNEENSFIWKGERLTQKRGQFITGRKKLKEITGIPETTIEGILDYLESQHQIRQQKTSGYRLITILNWETYQNSDIVSDNKPTTNRQRADTIKNDKNVKNDKNNTSDLQSQEEISLKELDKNGIPNGNQVTTKVIPDNQPFSLQEEIKKLEDSPRRDLNIIAMYLEERKPDIRNREQLSVAIKRHLRPAKQLASFTDNQLLDALPKEKKATEEFTLETIIKVLCK